MNELIYTIQFVIAVQALGIVAWPLANKFLGSFPDKGWAFSKILGTLLVSYFVWLTGSLHIIPYSETWTLIATLLLGGVLYIFWGKSLFPLSKNTLKWILWEELLFVVVFSTWTYIRGFAPDTEGLEKFMDYGFMVSALRGSYFPPLDHFLASETINYYYYGHYIASVVTRLAGVPAYFGYNLQMSNIFALAAVECFALGSMVYMVLAKNKERLFGIKPLIAGVLSACFVTLFGNFHAAIYLLKDAEKYWYPDATRFIENTIHEFPMYSFIVNDLHGHVSSIPLVFIVLALWIHMILTPMTEQWVRKEHVLLALVVGTLYCINAWDLPIYLILSGILVWALNAHLTAGSIDLTSLFHFDVLKKTAVTSVVLAVGAVGFYLPFWTNFEPISQGIGLVPFGAQSPLWQLAILWGVHLPILIWYLIWFQIKQISFKKEPIHLLIIGMSIVSILLILLPEVMYMKDIYPVHYRANTMFKFYYQAWNMVGVLCGALIVYLWSAKQQKDKLSRYAFQLLTLIIIVAAAMYPYKAIKQGVGGLAERSSIDGHRYLQLYHPQDYAAIHWINKNITGQPVLLEAVGDSYTYYTRIATNTGLPAVLGWPVHEWLWRGSYGESLRPKTAIEEKTGVIDTVGQRVTDVQTIYETTDIQQATDLLNRYKVDYIYVGPAEYEKYASLSEEKFSIIGEKVYDENDVRIYFIKKANR